MFTSKSMVESVEQTWSDFMKRGREARELVKLAIDPEVLPFFQERAIQTLLAPSISQLPFRVNQFFSLNTYAGHEDKWLSDVSASSATYIANLIPEYIEQAQQQRSNGEGALIAYNSIIPRLLDKLPAEEAEKLFGQFAINDLFSYWNMDFASGYGPLRDLYSSPIQEVWKRKGAERMHSVIQEEIRGRTKPRAEHENAYSCYSNILGLLLYSNEGLPVSREFYQDEIAFMTLLGTGNIVDIHHTGQVLDLLEDASIKHRFARRQILGGKPDDWDRFRVNSTERASEAKRVIEEFPEDQELRAYLEAQLEDWPAKAGELMQRQSQIDQEELEVRTRMRTL
ncbi:hypothetical protein A3C99_00165 [Candidatus Daviesbacteria bacterium RIFCSPHIGHO2_02_FULL_37_9]|nr:MAG: hypothetical protein A3C99_00165 [Candidatus Daviesbacteria bacterium RIFCSPHIGHO2_02_FULL_37_9]